ncbi:ABC transporter permease [Mycoplasmatota bacterium zrk1]
MALDIEFIAHILNSTFRLMTPILLVALGSAVCNRVFIFNIGLEGMMLTGAFFAIVANYYTGSVLISLLAAMGSAMFVSWIAGIFMVKFKGAMLVVGISVNVLMLGATTFLMQLFFGVKGAFVHKDLVSLPKVNVEFLKGTKFFYTLFGSLTYLDYFAVILAIILYFYMFKTVSGFRLRSIGINKEAANSIGVNGDKIQIGAIVFSGLLSGLGGALLSMGAVTMFVQNITSGRGFMAMAAGSLGSAHPIGVVFASTFFGLAQTLSNVLDNQFLSSELMIATPYVATIVALAIFNYSKIKKGGKITNI